MTRDEMIRMARKAGMGGMLTDVVCTYDELERFAALVAAAEREECAKLCDGWTHADGDVCAAAIRARTV